MGEMIYFDIKKFGCFNVVGYCVIGDCWVGCLCYVGWDFLYVCVDDVFRLVYIEILFSECKEDIIVFLICVFDWFGCYGVVVEWVMIDNGLVY